MENFTITSNSHKTMVLAPRSAEASNTFNANLSSLVEAKLHTVSFWAGLQVQKSQREGWWSNMIFSSLQSCMAGHEPLLNEQSIWRNAIESEQLCQCGNCGGDDGPRAMAAW